MVDDYNEKVKESMRQEERSVPFASDYRIVLETKDLKKQYMQGKVVVHALRGINMTVEKGELMSIRGPSGSGKSTLLNMIGALDRPTSGTIILEGQNIARMDKNQLAEVRQRIGFVFQYFNLIGRLSALENVQLPLSVRGMPGPERKAKAMEVLDLVGLSDRIKHKPSELSGGQQQRVSIARALTQEPSFLLMDEPTGNIDTKTRDSLLQLIKMVNHEKKITTIIITHDAAVAKITNRQVYIVDGLLYNTEDEAIQAEMNYKAIEGENGNGTERKMEAGLP
nr:ABC transporter ATP-binding protein [Candidatus Sigynarchaeota archaeon]